MLKFVVYVPAPVGQPPVSKFCVFELESRGLFAEDALKQRQALT